MYDEKIDALLDRFEKHRESIEKMIAEMEELKAHINKILPNKMDQRHYRFFEEKVKAITGFFNILLEMRKEIAKSIKDEVEIRRKIKTGDDDFDPEKDLDLGSIAKAVRKIDEDRKKLKKKVLNHEEKTENGEPAIEEIDVDIPGFNAPLPTS